jgi:hypothetical protein
MHGMIHRQDDIYEVAKHLGEIVAQARKAKPALAVAAAKAALDHKLDEDDVNELFGVYIKASSEMDRVDPTDNSFKANASKLRTIVKCALEYRDTLDVLERVTNRHDRLQTKASLFDAMVSVCRLKIEHEGTLSAEDLDNAIMI